MPEESRKTGLREGFIKKSKLNRVNEDSTVQEKAVRYPTDARLYDRMRERLVKSARPNGVELRQTWVEWGKKVLRSKKKLYLILEPQVECIGKGKAHKKFEFGPKIGLMTSSKNNWIVGAEAYPGNPYDGHTLKSASAQTPQILGFEP